MNTCQQQNDETTRTRALLRMRKSIMIVIMREIEKFKLIKIERMMTMIIIKNMMIKEEEEE
jgi:hypothetical protein